MTTHTVNMTNNCGFGVPTLDQVPSIVLATGSQSYTNGTVQAVSFLNTGYCGPNGGNCTTVDISMNGTISIVVLDLIPTHEFSVPVSFTYFNGCNGAGVSCLSSTCVNAIRDPSQNSGIVTCSQPGAGVLVIFCPNLVITPTSSASSIAPSSSTLSLSSAINPTSKSATLSHAAIIGGAVGGVVGGLVILIACLIWFLRFRRRRSKQLEEHAIDEFRVPAPPSADHNRTGAWKHDPSRPSTPQLVQPPSVTPIDSGPSSPSAGVRQLPLPPQAPNFTAPPPVAIAPTSDNLDRIIESLAERFGWTAPPSGADSSYPVGHLGVAPPEYS